MTTTEEATLSTTTIGYPREPTYQIHYDTFEDIFGRPRPTMGAPFRPRTTTLGYGPPARPRTTTLGAPMRPPTTEMPFPEGVCEVPPITAVDATPDTPVLYEVTYNMAKAFAEFKIFGLDADAQAMILRPSTDLMTSPTFNPSTMKAIVATLPYGSPGKIPLDLVAVIVELNTRDKVQTYLYNSYDGYVRVVAVFEVDRQAAYENIFKKTTLPLQVYDVTPYQGPDDVHDEEGPVIISAHMGVRVALNSEIMCGGVPPQPPQTTVPAVKGCHSDRTGMTYRNGESWSEDDCTNCTCVDGFSACYVMDCFMMDCEHVRDVPGQCCHECLDVEPPTSTPEFTPWTQWGKCYFRYGHQHCGMGYQYRERDVDNSESQVRYEPKQDEIYEERSCFEACLDDDDNVDITKCAPESICDYPDPVCGSAEPGPTTTFRSECELNIKACQKGNLPIKLYSGMCNPEDDIPANQICERDGPIRTTVKYEYEDEMEQCFGPVTDIKTCASLLCKGGSKTCCKATNFEPIEVSVSCYSINPREFLRFKKHVHYSATADVRHGRQPG